ncbi:MAG: IMP dehydrogenase [Pseudomonadota bacterium]|nr:IMP dehydrogenase [Pseudomonadota bacterium]
MTSQISDSFWIGKTFDDFLFRPQKGICDSRRRISLASRLTSTLALELPIISANMDSVTGKRMAETLSLEGGLGVIHRALPIDKQVAKVAAVKRSYSAVIEEPFRLPLGTPVAEAVSFARRHNIGGILIETTPGSGILAGVLSRRDIPWSDEARSRPVDAYMTPIEKLHTHAPGISVEEAERILFEKRIERLPLIDANRRIQGLVTRKDILFRRERPYASRDHKGRLLVAAAIGARGDFLERASELVKSGVDCLVIDIAHGHSSVMADAVEQIRNRVGKIPLIGGNVSTGAGALFLKELGVDAVKVGVGPGRGCRTRLETAAGVPQLQAIREAWCAVEESIPIIADGGVSHDKDIFLALICGASAVMLGSALSGTDEAPGLVIEDPISHTKKKIYRGMTSPEAVFESLYGVEDPDLLEEALETPAEGQETQVPYKGSVVGVLGRIRGHLQSAVSYAGEDSLANSRKKIVPDPRKYLIPLSEASWRESYDR